MAKYTVNADAHDVHTLTEDGKVKATARYKRGDVLEMDEVDAERLVKTGGLVEVDGEVSDESVAPRPPASLSGQTAEQSTSLTADQAGASGDSETAAPGAVATPEAGGVIPVRTDEYDDDSKFSYADLVALAKENGIAATGDRQTLTLRIREYDISNA